MPVVLVVPALQVPAASPAESKHVVHILAICQRTRRDSEEGQQENRTSHQPSLSDNVARVTPFSPVID